MQRKVRREDFEALAHLMAGSTDGGFWGVCDDYELRGDSVVAKFSYRDSKRWKLYEPLTDVPDLFLRFARLCEEPGFKVAALAFSRKFGLPGSETKGADGSGERKMPESLSLSQIHAESKRAQAILALYEAALNVDPQAARTVFSESRHDPAFKFYHDALSIEYPEWETDLLPRELWFALDCAGRVAKRTSDKYCRQWCFPAPRSPFGPQDWGLATMWRFDNLVGAMYLQAYWMMTSEGELNRCEYCSRIISLARPHPEARKSRRDKRFCDDACRQANHRSKKKT